MRLALLMQVANLVPQTKKLSPYPAVDRDLNLVVDESVHWADVAHSVREAAGAFLERLQLQDVYRNAERGGRAYNRGIPGLGIRIEAGIGETA